jgi:hypothetical protein
VRAVASDDTVSIALRFTPFSGPEVHELERVHGRAREIAECSFYKDSLTLQVKGGGEQRPGMQSAVEHAGEDSLATMLRLMRPFYAKRDNWFARTRQMLRLHAEKRDTPEARMALEVLGDLGTEHKRILRKGYSIEPPSGVPPQDILDDYLRIHFHGDDPHLRVWEDDSTRGIAEFVAVDTAMGLGTLYIQFGSIATEILEEPSLRLDALAT